MRTIAIALLFCACTTPNVGPLGQTAIRDCGPRPAFPGDNVSQATVNGYQMVVMHPSDWATLDAWVTAIDTWSTCVAEHP